MTAKISPVEHQPLTGLKPHKRQARRHSKAQIRQIADSIERFGFTNPVLVSDAGDIIAGHGRVEAARLLGLATVPTIRLSHLSEAERRAYVLADNKLALNAGWDVELLALELADLTELGIEIESTGFSIAEVDVVLEDAQQADPKAKLEPADKVPALRQHSVSRKGDLWLLGRHRLLCGDARENADHEQVLDGRKADLIFTDPPYNVKIDGNVCGLGEVRHPEFAMASGEMSKDQFIVFLTTTLGAAAKRCRDGAIAFVFMDWRHVGELQQVGELVFSELKNLCVWNKTNAGMGTFYRSQHELILVFKVGDAPHTNNFGLGATGRYRTNVWTYPGISSPTADRQASLEMHPTVKPTKLVMDAILDCSKRGQVVLDPFAGSGTTLIAADRCGRTACVIEFDPHYCDTIVRRWQILTGKQAKLEAEGVSFEEMTNVRLGETDEEEPEPEEFD